MKKVVAIVAACAVLALSVCMLAGCGSKELVKDNKFIVGFDAEYPPYGFVGEDGQYTGFDLDLATEVASRNNWKIEYQAIDWDAKDSLIEAGTITCIWNGFTYEGREDDYAWSEPYMLNSQVIVSKAGVIADEAALAGKNVLTQAGSAAEEILQGDMKDLTATFKSLNTIADYNNAFMQLEAGLVDAVACDLSIYAYQAAAKPDAYSIAVVLSPEHYAVGFKKGSTDLAKKVTETLQAMVKDGTVDKIAAKYAEYGISMDNWCLEAK